MRFSIKSCPVSYVIYAYICKKVVLIKLTATASIIAHRRNGRTWWRRKSDVSATMCRSAGRMEERLEAVRMLAYSAS